MVLDLDDDEQLKEALKQALIEVLHEQPGLFAEVLTEALESFMLAHGIRAEETKQDAPQTEAEKKMARGA